MKNQNIMFTRSIPNMSKARLFRSVLALAGVALIMQVSLPRAQAYDLSSLNASYADSFAGFAPPTPQANSYGPVYEAGLYTFDGAGGFMARNVFNFGGGAILNASWSQNVTGTYTVNANGTMTWTDHRRHFVIGAGGNELKYVGTDPNTGIVVGGSMVKTVAGNSSETARDQPSRFTVWRLIVSPSAGKHALWCVGDCVLDSVSRPTEGNKEDKGSLSPELKRFEKCCSHRPVDGLLPAALFHIRETAHRAVATAAAVLFNSIQMESSLSSLPSV